MNMDANEYVVADANVEPLANWLDAGLWSRDDASYLFLDIDPDTVKLEQFSTFSGHGQVNYCYYDDDDPYSIMEYRADEDDKPNYLDGEQWALWHRTQRARAKIARSINRYESEEPHVWIALAHKKRIAIPWLDWAIENKLYGQNEGLEKRPAPEPEKVDLTSPPQIGMDAPEVAAAARSESDSRSTATSPRFSMTRAAMLEKHKQEWPTIERDIKDAARNGLNKAKAGARDWWEDVAMEWASAKGKLKSIDKPTDALRGAIGTMASLPISRTHTLEG